jgi:hypothetical protein
LGPKDDYFAYFSLRAFKDCNFTPMDHPKLGPTFIHWDDRPYEPANRRANKILRQSYTANYARFPRSGARGEALIRHGAGERYYIPIAEGNTPEEAIDWAEANLIKDSWYIYGGSIDQCSLILGNDEGDHFKAKMRFG